MCVFFGMRFNLMCECAQLFLAIARVPGAYLVLQYATTHTMPTTSSATQMPVIVSTRFWYSSSASEWTRAMDKHTHMHRRTQRQTHMYTTTIEHKDTYIQNTQPLHQWQPLNHVKTNSLSLKHFRTSVYISCYSCKRPYLSLLNRFI